MKSKILFISGLIILELATGCNKETTPVITPDTKFTNGVFISNEGKFPDGTGTVSFLKREGTLMYNEVYQNANGMKPLGSIVQCIEVIGDIAFIAVNNADKIEMVIAENCLSVNTLENISTPADILSVAKDKIYISSWSNVVYSIKSDGTEIFGKIPVGTGPTKLANVTGKIWVLNQGGFSVDSTVSVIDPETDQVIKTIDLYPLPSGIAAGQGNLAWVLCRGRFSYQGSASKGHLLAVSSEDYSIQKDLIFPDTMNHPEFLQMDKTGQYLFYNYVGGIYRYKIGNDELENTPFIAYSGYLYSLAYDPKADVLYTSDPVDFLQRGWIFRFDASSGAIIDSVNAGIVPRDFEFVD